LVVLAPFSFEDSVPLVTGGGSGIGFGLVEEFLKLGAKKVLITGRREEVLVQAAEKYPGRIQYFVNDAEKETDRVALLEWVTAHHADCNVLVNNAGVQRRVAPVQDVGSWKERASEIEVNFNAPVHLCTLFIPHLLTKPTAMLINITSGLAFVPFTIGPVYGATKAALHNYTMGLRYSLSPTNVRVVEIAPPAVKTNLGGSHSFGEDCDVFCARVVKGVAAGNQEVGSDWRLAGRQEVMQWMLGLSKTMHVPQFPAQ
jgi:uncharacterized oxidoreductase